MPGLREVRELLLVCHSNGTLKDDEFVLLYNENISRNPDFPYWTYDRFALDEMTDAECKAEFRFFRNDIYSLADVLHLPPTIVTYNGLVVQSIPALCMLLKRFAYPCRYGDMISRFARPVPQLSIITSHMLDLIYSEWHQLLTTYNHNLLSPANLSVYADAIQRSGAALNNCGGFIDGTVRPVCRPGINQRVLYNGHKRVHSIKFQAIALPNGLVGNLYGPVEGKRHDSGMLASSHLLEDLQRFSFSPTGLALCIYGDPAYPLRIHLQAPFRGAALTPQQKAYNKSMSTVRVSVEWIFNDILNYFKFLDFKKNLKVGLSPVGKMYIVCAILQNARSILYKSITSQYFGVDPPTLDEYFV